jgi:hypothetical protein
MMSNFLQYWLIMLFRFAWVDVNLDVYMIASSWFADKLLCVAEGLNEMMQWQHSDKQLCICIDSTCLCLFMIVIVLYVVICVQVNIRGCDVMLFLEQVKTMIVIVLHVVMQCNFIVSSRIISNKLKLVWNG